MKQRDQSPLCKIIQQNHIERDSRRYSQNRSSCGGGNIEDIIHQRNNEIGKSALLSGDSKDIISSSITTTFDNISSIKTNTGGESRESQQHQQNAKGSVQVLKQIILTSPSYRREESNHLKGKKITQRKVMELAQIKTKQLPAHMSQFEQHCQVSACQSQINHGNLNQKESQNPSSKKALQSIPTKQQVNPNLNLKNLNQNIGNLNTPLNSMQPLLNNHILHDSSNSQYNHLKSLSPLFSPKRMNFQTQALPQTPNNLNPSQHSKILSNALSPEKSINDSVLQTNEQSLITSPNQRENRSLMYSEESNLHNRKLYKVRISYFIDPNFPQVSNKNKSLHARDQQYIAFTNKLKSRLNHGNTQKFYSNAEKPNKQHSASHHSEFKQLDLKTNLPSLLNGSDICSTNPSSTYKRTPIVFPSFPLNTTEDIVDSSNTTNNEVSSNSMNQNINHLRRQPYPILSKENNLSLFDNLNTYQQRLSNKNQLGNLNNNNTRQQVNNASFEYSQSSERAMGLAILKKKYQRARINTLSDMGGSSNLLSNSLTKSRTEYDDECENDNPQIGRNNLQNYSNLFQKQQFYQIDSNSSQEENMSKFIFNSQILKAGSDLVQNKNTSSNEQQQENNDQPSKIQDIYKIEAFKEINFQTLRYYYDQKYHQKLVLSPQKLPESEKKRQQQHIEFNAPNRSKGISLHENIQPFEVSDQILKNKGQLINQRGGNNINGHQKHIANTAADKLNGGESRVFQQIQPIPKEEIQLGRNKVQSSEGRNQFTEQSNNRNNPLAVSQQFQLSTEQQDPNLAFQQTQDFSDSNFNPSSKLNSTKKQAGMLKNQSKLKQQSEQLNDKLDFEKLEPWDNKDQYVAYEEEYFEG